MEYGVGTTETQSLASMNSNFPIDRSAALTGRVQYYLPQATTVLAISGFQQLHQYPHSSTLQSLRRSSTPLANSCLNFGDAVDARRSTSSESEINTSGLEAGTPGHHQTRESATEPPECNDGNASMAVVLSILRNVQLS